MRKKMPILMRRLCTKKLSAWLQLVWLPRLLLLLLLLPIHLVQQVAVQLVSKGRVKVFTKVVSL